MASAYDLKELKIEVNRNCPLKCLHCSSNGMPGAPERLSPDRISNLIREFSHLGGEKLCISGGEPLCYQELPTVVDSCRGTNIDLSIYTTGIVRNGSPAKPISERMAGFLANNSVKVIFSLHGAHERTHDALTQTPGSFISTLTAIEKTVEAGATIEIHVVPTTINFHELTEITRLADSFNIKKVSWLRFVPQGRGFLNRHALQLSKEQLKELGKKKTDACRIYPTMTIRTGAPFNILCPQVPAPCEAGINILTITPDGSVSPCDAFKRFRMPDDFGNILHHSLTEVWHNSYTLNTVRSLHESRLSSSCASCSLYTRCNSGCLAQRAIATGKLIDGKDPECLLNSVGVRCGDVEGIPV